VLLHSNTTATPIEGEIDLAVYGPPDLAIEVEVSQGVIPKMRIYQALKVSEIWRYSSVGITPMHRTAAVIIRHVRIASPFPISTWPNSAPSLLML